MATEALSNVKFETLTAKGFTKLAKATYYGEDPWTKVMLTNK